MIRPVAKKVPEKGRVNGRLYSILDRGCFPIGIIGRLSKIVIGLDESTSTHAINLVLS